MPLATLLEEIVEVLPWKATIRSRTRTTNFSVGDYTTVTLGIYDQEARAFFAAAGVTIGRKSTTIAPPAQPFSSPDYVRGVVDGDGSLGFTAKGYVFVSVVTASEELAFYLCQVVTEVCGVTRTARRNARDGVFNIMVSNHAAQKLSAWLYYPGALALPRKAQAAVAIAAWTAPSSRFGAVRRSWSPEEDEVVRANSAQVAVERLGRSRPSVDMRRWRLGLTQRRVRGSEEPPCPLRRG